MPSRRVRLALAAGMILHLEVLVRWISGPGRQR